MRKQAHAPEESARERILQAALDLLIERGYKGATTAEIAKRAGVAELTLFRQFGSKAELITQAFERLTVAPVDGVMLASGDLEGDLVELAERYLAYLEANKSELVLLVAEILRQPELLGGRPTPAFGAFMAQLIQLVVHYQATGALARGPADRVAFAFVGPLIAKVLLAEPWGFRTVVEPVEYVRAFLGGHGAGPGN